VSFLKSLPEGAQSFDVFASRPDVYALHDAVVVACIGAAGRAVEQEGYLSRFQERLAREEDDAEE